MPRKKKTAAAPETAVAQAPAGCPETEAPAAEVPAAEAPACCCGASDAPAEVIGCRHKKRSEEERRALTIRLNRVEGQIKGIRKMVENDIYCPDILVQVAAATAALNGFSKELLNAHIRTCIAQDIRDGKDESLEELLRVLQKLMR